jgi:vacuolar protein sorting-associated protein 45
MKGESEKGKPNKNFKPTNLVEIQRDYLLRMMDEVSGRKVLIVDENSMKLISMLVAQSELLQREVYLVEKLEEMSKEKDIGTLKSLILISPSPQNITILEEELANFSITMAYLCKVWLTT